MMENHSYAVIVMNDGVQLEGDEGAQAFHTESVAYRYYTDRVAAHHDDPHASVFFMCDAHSVEKWVGVLA